LGTTILGNTHIYTWIFTETVMPQLHPNCIAVVFFARSQVHPWR